MRPLGALKSQLDVKQISFAGLYISIAMLLEMFTSM
jgi:hypothetical protein